MSPFPAHPGSLGPRAGTTLAELLAVVGLAGLLAMVAVPAFHDFQDRLAVEGAAAAGTRAMADARHHAVRRGQRTALLVDSTADRLTILTTAGPLAVHDLGATWGVQVSSTRDSIAWSPTGLGYGASNARVVLRRGAAAESIVVSRLGRVRR